MAHSGTNPVPTQYQPPVVPTQYQTSTNPVASAHRLLQNVSEIAAVGHLAADMDEASVTRGCYGSMPCVAAACNCAARHPSGQILFVLQSLA